MTEPIRIVPQWEPLKSQLKEKLEALKGLPEATEDVMLSDRPSILFRESCYPSLMPLICFYPSSSTNYFASFTWRGTKGRKSQVRLWMYGRDNEAPVAEKDYTLEEDPKVLLVTHVPSRNLFVAYCNDIHLRIFGDHTQDLKLLLDRRSPYSITSMCYNPEMCELVTGAIGLLAFWSFGTEDVPSLSVMQSVPISSGEFVHFLSVERERRVLVALCENIILVFDYQSKVKIRAFQVSQGVSLTCCSAHWLQSFLYAGDLAGDVKVWNLDTGSQTHHFKAHLSAIISVVSRVSVHTLMTASLDGLMKEWNLTTCELLRRVDIGEPVFQMQFISEQTFFLRTQYTFSIRTINNFYQLFNRPNSILKKLVRIQCGPERARILAATEDGVIRFLSPVTGEMLFVTWPFQLLGKALDYVYDPDREELLVTMGTNDIYVLDTTRNPCPCKHILRTTDSVDDKVLCLAYSRLELGGHTFSFIFSGYKSGRVRSVTQHLYRMGSRRIHDGNVVALSSISASSGNLSYCSRESSYLCSYGSDEYIILSDVILKRNSLLEVEPLVCIPSFHCRVNHLLLIPGYICVLTEQNRVRLWRQAALVPGRKNPFWKETGTMHSSSITSFDYCHALSMLVTSGSDGSVRLWDILGQMLVEFDTSLKFSRVCFANQRGDLVVGCNKNIYFISCVTYLPRRHLSRLAAQHVRDDMTERPLPFLPHFLLRFDIVFVPKYHQVGKHAKKYDRLEPITNHKELVIEKGLVKVVECTGIDASTLPQPDFYGVPLAVKEALPGVAVKYQLMPQSTLRKTPERKPASLEHPRPQPYCGLPPVGGSAPMSYRIPFQTGRSWPVAPDGYIPNSVIRARLFPKGTPPELQCSLLMTRHPLPRRKMVKVHAKEHKKPEHAPPEKVRKKKIPRVRRVPAMPEGQRRRDLLADIVAKPWLRHKPSEMTVPCVTRTILKLMDDVPFSTYLMCTAALVQIAESYTLPPEVQGQAFERLMQDTNHKEVRMRVAAWEALGKMDLLGDKDVVPLAQALLDDNKRLRDLARSLLDSVAGITDKFVLQKEMQRLAKSSLEELKDTCQPTQSAFPHRLRAAGIAAESRGDAVHALMEVSQKLLNRVEAQLTANLFLMSEHPTEEGQDQDSRSPPGRRRLESTPLEPGEAVEEAAPETHVEAKARWLGLFDAADAKSPGRRVAIEAAKGHQTEKVSLKGEIRSTSRGNASAMTLSRELLSESSTAGSSSSSSSTSGSTWQEVQPQHPQQPLKPRSQHPGARATHSPPQEAPKPAKGPKLIQPVPLQRRDTRTQLYTEMLRHQQLKKEQAGPPPLDPKQESSTAHAKPSPAAPPAVLQDGPKGSLIDPNQEYSIDKSKWRSDLYKLLMLRIAPCVEGRTATEDLLASARVALGGRAMSWELFANISQSILTSKEKITPEPTKLRKYIEQLFKTSPWELWPKPAVESKETVVAVKMGREIPGAPESETEGSSLEDMPGIKGEEAEPEGVKVGTVKAVAEKKPKGEAQVRKKKAAVSVARGKKVAEEGKEDTEEDEGEEKVSGKGREAVRQKEQEPIRGKEQELAKEKEQEPIRGKEQELAKEKEQEPIRGKERELAKEKDQEAVKQRGQEAAERKERERARRRATRRAEKIGTGAKEKGGDLAKESEEDLEEDRSVTEAAETTPSEMKEWVLDESQDAMLAELKERILAEAQEIALAELREQAIAKSRERVLAELRERALAEARKEVLDEVREKALAEARERVLAEVRQSTLAEARDRVLSEVRERALAEARGMLLAEGAEGELPEERVMKMAEQRMRELMEAKLRELSETWTMEVDTARVEELAEARLKELDEATVMELAKAKVAEPAEAKVEELAEAREAKLAGAKIAEQTEARIRELAKAKAAELSEAQITELAEARVAEQTGARIRELAGAKAAELAAAKVKELAEARAVEVAAARTRELATWEEVQRADGSKELLYEGGEAEVWEEPGEEAVKVFSEEEREALMVALQEQRVHSQELGYLDHAQLLLDILTQPERLEGSDSKVFQRLFQVVSLLQIPSGFNYKELAEFLLHKADEIAKAGEAEDKHLAKDASPVYVELRKVVEAHQPPRPDTREFAARMQALLKAARVMLRARALKEQLERGFQERAWWEKAQKEWLEDEGRVVSKKAWADQRLRKAVRKWHAEQKRIEKAMQGQQHQDKNLPLRSRPFELSGRKRERSGERREEKQIEREAETLDRQGGQRQPKTVSWSLGKWPQKARESLWKREGPPAIAEEHYPAPRRKAQRLPKDSLYLPTKLPPIGRSKIRRGPKQHTSRLPEKAVDWEMFSMLYQSLVTLKEVEGGVGSTAWHELFGKLLDLYGLSNRLIRALVQQLLTGDYGPRKSLPGKDLPISQAEAHLGARLLCQVVHHSARVLPKPPTLHGVIPLSYQNNVHPFDLGGVTSFGTLSLKWKTFFSGDSLPKPRFYVQPQHHSK